MMGFCPYDGEACHHDGYCDDCQHNKETWSSFHGQLEVTKGTFDKIWNDEEGDSE